ncbi:MAG: hypothetical protein COA78_09880 [Blastopirellula sp.]|nr:MAG: hypothetical protein COA78_09880 [Blastopirellula sp.]
MRVDRFYSQYLSNQEELLVEIKSTATLFLIIDVLFLVDILLRYRLTFSLQKLLKQQEISKHVRDCD